MSRLEDEKAPVSFKLGLALVSHTANNSGDFLPNDQP